MITVDGETLTVEGLYKVSTGEGVEVPGAVYQKISRVRKILERYTQENRPIYGVTTSFGEMALHLIPKRYEQDLQNNLVRSHSCNVGPDLDEKEVRAMMAARANCLATGKCGIKPETLKLLVDFLNLRIHPRVPEMGTVGASGDLGPLSHVALALIGEGECRIPMPKEIQEYAAEKNVRVDPPVITTTAEKALAQFNLRPLQLGFKEGLALINGTSATTGLAALNVAYGEKLCSIAHKVAALSSQALGASTKAFDPKGQKPHPGQVSSASKLTYLLEGSGLVRTHNLIVDRLSKQYDDRSVVNVEEYIQDAYSLRATPQILGAALDTLKYAWEVVTRELNSPNDNPLFFEDGDVFHGANFHGQAVAFAMDYLSIALTQVGNLSERRLNRLLDKKHNRGLPEFLTPNTPGLSLGFEGLQYVAVEACAENRVLSTPASVQSIPSNEDNQDIVPMSFWASRKCKRVVTNLAAILSCEAIASCQAVEFRDPRKLSLPTRRFYADVRSIVPKLTGDRPLYKELAELKDWMLA